MAGLLSFLPVYAILFSSHNGGQRERGN